MKERLADVEAQTATTLWTVVSNVIGGDSKRLQQYIEGLRDDGG